MKGNQMYIIIDENTTIEKEKLIIDSLKSELKEDKLNNDYKSIKYHTMALKEHKRALLKLEKKLIERT